MLRFATFLCVVFASIASPSARAGDVPWTATDKADLAALAKKAKKNGEMYTVTGEVFETRLPTREAAAEFSLYFERLAERVRPLWGTRENTTKLVAIGMHPKDAAWPDYAKDRKIFFESQNTKQQPDIPQSIASLSLWIDPSLTGDALTVGSIASADLSSAGIQALLKRLAGLNPLPPWVEMGMSRAFADWSPASSDTGPARLDAATRKPEVVKLILEQLATKKDPTESLVPFFVKSPKGPAHPTLAEDFMFTSFFVYLVEDKKGRTLFVDTCECLSRGKPVQIEKKQIAKLVPSWLAWSEYKVAPVK